MRGRPGVVGWVIAAVTPTDARRTARVAALADTPSRSRPTTSKSAESGDSRANALAPLGARMMGRVSSGIHMMEPGLSDPIEPANRGGATPTIRTGRPLIVTV